MLNEDNLHGYQWEAIDHVMVNTHCALFLDMGLGKTVSTLTAIKKLMYEELDIAKTLVIAPKRVAENVWSAEVKKWSHLNNMKIVRIAGSQKQRLMALQQEGDVYMLGRDNVAWLCAHFGGLSLPFDMLVIDESSSFKNHKSVRFKALKKVQPSFKRVVLLTGTPAPNGLSDLWSQIYLLDRGLRLGKFIGEYRRKYFRPGMTVGHTVYKYNIIKSGKELIYQKIQDICMSMKAKDYLDLPARINNYIKLPLPTAIKNKYDDFEKEQVLSLLEEFDAEKDISVANAAALSNKLLQFANGAVYDEDRNWHVIHDLKIKETESIIEQAGGNPVLIAWTYRHDMLRLMDKLKKYEPRRLEGEDDILDWNDGKIQVMLMHPASGGHGLNLQAGGNIIIWFGQTWSLELYQQFNARLDRQGQTKPVVINHLISEGTIDEKVIKVGERKDKEQQSLMDAVKSLFRKYK